MASTKRQIIISLAMLAVASTFTTVMYLNRPPADIQEPVYTPITVDVAEAVREDLSIPIQAQGTVTPLRATSILAEVKGRVVEVAPTFNVGGFVREGDVLLRIDPRDYETNLLRAQAAVESAESNLAQEKGRAEVALREWQKLPKGSQRSEEARDLYLRKPQLEQAEAQLLASKADLDTARDNLDRTVIRAPYDAIIRAKHSELGQFVAGGSQLADIFSVEAAEIRLPIPQGKLDYLALPGIGEESTESAIDLYTDVGGVVKHWPARLVRTEGVFDERSRALYAVARVDDPYALEDSTRDPLRIGTFVNANIQGRILRDLVPLPRYVLRAGGLVWVVDEQQYLRNREVTLLRTGGDTIYVTAGLNDGDLVSLTTLDSSFDGSKVRIQSQVRSDDLYRDNNPGVPEPDALNEATVVVDPAVEAAVDPVADTSTDG